MDQPNQDHDGPGATGSGITTQEQIEAIAAYVEAAIEPLTPLLMGEARTETIANLAKMKEAVRGNPIS